MGSVEWVQLVQWNEVAELIQLIHLVQVLQLVQWVELTENGWITLRSPSSSEVLAVSQVFPWSKPIKSFTWTTSMNRISARSSEFQWV